MLYVDRADYVSHQMHSYADTPLPIGMNQTISAPHMHAHALDLMADKLTPGASVLDVGCGSGYLVAVLAKMVGENGKVVGIDTIPELVELSRQNIMKSDSQLIESGNVELHGELIE